MLVHAELIFEHVALGLGLENALLIVAAGGAFSVVLQLPSEEEHVASTSGTSLQSSFASVLLPSLAGAERIPNS